MKIVTDNIKTPYPQVDCAAPRHARLLVDRQRRSIHPTVWRLTTRVVQHRVRYAYRVMLYHAYRVMLYHLVQP